MSAVPAKKIRSAYALASGATIRYGQVCPSVRSRQIEAREQRLKRGVCRTPGIQRTAALRLTHNQRVDVDTSIGVVTNWIERRVHDSNEIVFRDERLLVSNPSF